eukprot:g3152.t1
MYDYVTKELPDLIQKQCSNLDLSNAAIMGHSMGGHGALTVALKNPTRFKSLSVFSPISNPMKVPWGQKAFSGYLGDNQEDWKQYDACELLKKYEGPQIPWLVDTGTADQYLDIQLHPWTLEKICKEKNYPAVFRMQEGYDHSYFFIQSFIQKHLLHHAKVLGAVKSE